jgi:2,3-bisphosphoglycerate-dependent phosphoglycerate mutase
MKFNGFKRQDFSMICLIIARHGNTFEKGQEPTRVGARTDLPLTLQGREQGRRIGEYLKEHNMLPDMVYSSTLQRTQQTAEEAVKATGLANPVYPLSIFDEIDYGPDENKPESEVIARVGEQAIQDWNDHALVPPGWCVDPSEIIANWTGFAEQILKPDAAAGHNETLLVVTSNGIARFAPYLTEDFEGFASRFPLKLSTGALGVLVYEEGAWRVLSWNVRP